MLNLFVVESKSTNGALSIVEAVKIHAAFSALLKHLDELREAVHVIIPG